MTADDRLRIVVASALPELLVERLGEADPRFEVRWEPTLLPPPREDRTGPWTRAPGDGPAFEAYLDGAEALFGVPDHSGPQLARTVAANDGLRWVHSRLAGGAAEVRKAGLVDPHRSRVQFTSSGGVHAQPLAEFALHGVLAGIKQFGYFHTQQRDRRWAPRQLMPLFEDVTVAVVGLGTIGRRTTELLQAVGITVLGVNRSPVEVHGLVEQVGEVLGRVDAVVLALPDAPGTRNVVDAAALASSRALTVVNVERGTAINEDALLRALDDGRVTNAVLDVTAVEPLPSSSPLRDRPDVLLTPHTAAINRREADMVVDLFIDNARRFLDGEPLRNHIDPGDI